MTRAGVSLACLVCIGAALALGVPRPAVAQGPIEGALATLAAATVQAQATRQAQEALYAAQRATAQALRLEQTRTAARAQATATALSAGATQAALDEWRRQRALTATAQESALRATGLADALRAQATRQALEAQATRQAIDNAQQEQLARTYARRQEWFNLGLLAVELAVIAGALLVLGRVVWTLFLWARRMSPQPMPAAGASHVDVLPAGAGKEPTVSEPSPHGGRMPSVVTVVDHPGVVEAINQWADQYDETWEETSGD